MPTLRVMTFNIRGSFYAHDGANIWEHRAPLNIETILRYAPDLIGFQEVHTGNLATYRERLPQYDAILGPETDEPDLHDYNAIFWDPARLELLRSGGFYLSATPERWSRDWDAVNVHAATWAAFRIRETGISFLHLNTHPDHIGEVSRVEGSKLILRRIDEMRADTLPVIVTGDFNSNPWSPGYRGSVDSTFTDRSYHILRAHGFEDPYLAAGNEDCEAAHTYHGFEGEGYSWAQHHLAGRIDWILTLDGAQRLRTTSCTIARDHAHPLYPSDHYPVIADLTMTGAAGDTR